ncbi:MAG TPA: GNAT family N-acetyltransferase [Polyangiales bacterium]|nr:GNAT family N-acetyltransferase [Polyangiales bacterium]
MIVRELTPSDRAPLAELLARIAQFKPDEVEVALELIDAAIADPKGSGYECLVAVEGEALVGYTCVGPTPMTEATWDLYWIAVDPSVQGRGVGRALYAAFVERMRTRGGRNVRIETSSKEDYASTGGFYERLGFRIDGRLRDFYAEGDDLLTFYRRVDG